MMKNTNAHIKTKHRFLDMKWTNKKGDKAQKLATNGIEHKLQHKLFNLYVVANREDLDKMCFSPLKRTHQESP